MTVVWMNGNWRILEEQDHYYSLKHLKGDTYDPKHNPGIDPDKLSQEEKEFEDRVDREGVWGYILERWNPEVDCGWEQQDSCYGFVGRFSWGENNHYIVEEMITHAMKEGCDVCETCFGRGYLEVTVEIHKQQIEECEDCVIFSRDPHDIYRQAKEDGYKIDEEGYIL